MDIFFYLKKVLNYIILIAVVSKLNLPSESGQAQTGWVPVSTQEIQDQAEIKEKEIGIIRGHRVAFLKVNPIQYNPVKKETRVSSNIEVQINYNLMTRIGGSI